MKISMDKTLLLHRRRALLLFLVSLAIFLAGLWSLEIIRINCRYALMTAEIGDFGVGLFPTLNGKPYTDYPVTMIYLLYLATLGGRVVNSLTLALPSALAGALTVLLTYRLGERVRPNYGLTAALLLLFSWEFVSIARAPSLDLPVAALTVGMVLLEDSAARSRNFLLRAWLPLLLLTGFAIRGPLGVILPAAALLGWFLARREYRRAFGWGVVAAVLLLLASGLWLYGIYLAGGRDLLWLFFEDQILSRMDSLKSVFYYFTNALGSYAVAYPLGLLVIVVCFRRWSRARPEDVEGFYLSGFAGWALLILIGLSIPGTKHLRYMVPALPALALAAAWIFAGPGDHRLLNRVRQGSLLICRWLPLLTLLGSWGVLFALRVRYPGVPLPLFIPSLVLVTLALGSLALRRSDRRHDTLPVLALGAATMLATMILLAMPIDARLQSARAFTAELDRLRGDRPVRFLNLGPDGDDLKILVNLPPERRFQPSYLLWSSRVTPPPEPDFTVDPLREKLRQWIAPLPRRAESPLRPMFQLAVGAEKVAESAPETLFAARRDRLYPLVADQEELERKFRVLHYGHMGHRQFVIFEFRSEGKERPGA